MNRYDLENERRHDPGRFDYDADRNRAGYRGGNRDDIGDPNYRDRDENGRFVSDRAVHDQGWPDRGYGTTEWNDPMYRRSDGRSNSGVGGYRNSGHHGVGQFTGRGPKGYRRTDERIEEDVNEALTQHGELDASEIEVKVQNGEVILSGTVDERQFKRMAEEIAEGCPGVHDVRNEIRVQRNQETNGGNGASHQSKARSGTSSGKAS